jgi:hypothetical protein
MKATFFKIFINNILILYVYIIQFLYFDSKKRRKFENFLNLDKIKYLIIVKQIFMFILFCKDNIKY